MVVQVVAVLVVVVLVVAVIGSGGIGSGGIGSGGIGSGGIGSGCTGSGGIGSGGNGSGGNGSGDTGSGGTDSGGTCCDGSGSTNDGCRGDVGGGYNDGVNDCFECDNISICVGGDQEDGGRGGVDGGSDGSDRCAWEYSKGVTGSFGNEDDKNDDEEGDETSAWGVGEFVGEADVDSATITDESTTTDDINGLGQIGSVCAASDAVKRLVQGEGHCKLVNYDHSPSLYSSHDKSACKDSIKKYSTHFRSTIQNQRQPADDYICNINKTDNIIKNVSCCRNEFVRIRKNFTTKISWRDGHTIFDCKDTQKSNNIVSKTAVKGGCNPSRAVVKKARTRVTCKRAGVPCPNLMACLMETHSEFLSPLLCLLRLLLQTFTLLTDIYSIVI